MARGVHGHAERIDGLGFGFDQCPGGVLHAVFVLAPIRSVVVVLGEAVADDHQHLERGAAGIELRAGMPDRRPHARRPFRLHGSDGIEGRLVQGVVELLGDEELHEVAAVAGKPVDGIAIAQALERRTEEQHRLPENVDDPPLGGFGGHPGGEINILIVIEVGVADVLPTVRRSQ